jgi:hypothetical protein
MSSSSSSTGTVVPDEAIIGSYSGTGCITTDWIFGFVSVIINLVLVRYLSKVLNAQKSLDVPNLIRIFILVNFMMHFANFIYVEWLADTTLGVGASWVISVIIAVAAIAIGTLAKAEFIAGVVFVILFGKGWLPVLASVPIAVFVGLLFTFLISYTHMKDVGNLMLICEAIGFNIAIGSIGLFANLFRSSSAPDRCLDEHINIIFVCAADCSVVTTNDDALNRVFYLLGAAAAGIGYFIWLYTQVVCNNVPANSKTAQYKKTSCFYRTFCCCCYKSPEHNNFQKLGEGYQVQDQRQIEVAEMSITVGRGSGAGEGGVKKKKNKKKSKREEDEDLERQLDRFDRELGLDEEPLSDLKQKPKRGGEEDENNSDSEEELEKRKKLDAKQASEPVLSVTPALLAPVPDRPLPLPPSSVAVEEVKAGESKRSEQPLSA